MAETPGGALAKRPLHFIYVIDQSGSMTGKKIEAVNFAIRESISPMRDVAKENPNAEVLVRAITFSDGARWHAATPTNIETFAWTPVVAGGTTDMGKALKLLAEEMKTEKMPQRGLPPVIVLLTDGQPTDDFQAGLTELMAQPWGGKSVRIGIAIGEDADLGTIRKFIGNPEIEPLTADNVPDLVKKIKWASTVPLKAASNPNTKAAGSGSTGGVQIPAPPAHTSATSSADVF